MNDHDRNDLTEADGELIEPLPVPPRSIHPAWFLVAIVFGLALVGGLLALLNAAQRPIAIPTGAWPTATPYPARTITRTPTQAPIMASGTRLLPLTRENVGQVTIIHTFPTPITALRFATRDVPLRLDLLQPDALVRHELYSSWVYRIQLEQAFTPPVAFSTDPNTLATGGISENILIWNAQRGTVDAELAPLNARLTALAFSGNGMLLAGSMANGEILIWQVFNSTEQARLKVSAPIHALSYDRNGDHLVVASEGNPVRIYTDEQITRELPVTGTTTALAFSPDERWLAYNDDRTIHLLEFGTNTSARVFAEHTALVTAFGFTADGLFLASGDRAGQIHIWDRADGTLLTTLTLPTQDSVRQLEFNVYYGQSTLLVARDEAGLTSLWGIVEIN